MGKGCFKCGAVKPLSEFYAHPMMADGHLGKCKECTKRDVRSHRAANSDYYRACSRVRYYDRGQQQASQGHSEARARAVRKWRGANRVKQRAHNALARELRAGRIVRPSACSQCLKECVPHGHHDDYAKPREVRWLCSACHRAWHRKYDEQETRELVAARRSA